MLRVKCLLICVTSSSVLVFSYERKHFVLLKKHRQDAFRSALLGCVAAKLTVVRSLLVVTKHLTIMLIVFAHVVTLFIFVAIDSCLVLLLKIKVLLYFALAICCEVRLRFIALISGFHALENPITTFSL